MREVWAFLKALFRHWWAMMSCALFTLLGIYATATNRNNSWVFWASVFLAIACVLLAAFLAWREEYVKSLEAPEILMDWEPHERGNDTVKLRNIGKDVALNVALGEFSWEPLQWHRRIEFPSIDAGEAKTCEAQFRRDLSHEEAVRDDRGCGPTGFSGAMFSEGEPPRGRKRRRCDAAVNVALWRRCRRVPPDRRAERLRLAAGRSFVLA
jgi:hypothetical protein